jgi:hypothetical protein
MKRAVLGALTLMVAGAVCIPVFRPLGGLHGTGPVSAILFLTGGCILASPVIVLRVAGRWRVRELLVSICLFEIAFGIVLFVQVFLVGPGISWSPHGPGPIIGFLISMFAVGGGMAIPMLVGLPIAQALILWIDKTRSSGVMIRAVLAVAFLAIVVLLVWQILMTITGPGP